MQISLHHFKKGGKQQFSVRLRFTHTKYNYYPIKKETIKMVRLTLVVIALVVSLTFMGISYADIWYEQDFDGLKDGAIVGQDGWALHPEKPDLKSSTVQSKVAFGNKGKSLLVEGGQYVIKNFPKGKHGSTQHISFDSRKDSDPGGRTNHYIGGGDVVWDGSAVFSLGLPNMLRAFNAGSHDIVAPITLKKWLHVHLVIRFGDSQTYDIYIDKEKVVDNFPFRGSAKKITHSSLDWWFLGSSHVEEGGGPLVAYIDNISIGSGDGFSVTAVSSSGKLATTWAKLKR